MRRVFGALLIALSLIAFTFSSEISSSYTGSWEESLAYGGDAYTGIQNAAAQTANNVTYVGDILAEGFSYLFLLAGFILLACGLYQVIRKDTPVRVVDTNVAPAAVPGVAYAAPVAPVAPNGAYAPYSAAPYTAPNGAFMPQQAPVAPRAPYVSAAPKTPGSWNCTCGRVHPPYTTSCTCGVSKRDALKAQQEQL